MADVAIVGGTPLEYQIDVRPEALRAYGITLGELYAAVGKSNMPAGGGVVQKNNAEYIVRGVGWIKDKSDIENTVIKEVERHADLRQERRRRCSSGTQFRRSVYEKDGNEVVGGAVLMRHGENPLAVTERVKEKIQELQPGLPAGVHIVPAYDRTRLINGAIHTLTRSDVARDDHRLARHPADPDALPQRVRHLRHAAAGGAVLVPDDVAAARPAASSTSRPTSCRWPASRSRSASWSIRRS